MKFKKKNPLERYIQEEKQGAGLSHKDLEKLKGGCSDAIMLFTLYTIDHM